MPPENTTSSVGIQVRRTCNSGDPKTGLTPAGVFRASEAAGWLTFDTRRTCRARQGASSCCTASSVGEAREIKRARLPQKPMKRRARVVARAAHIVSRRTDEWRMSFILSSGFTPRSPLTEAGRRSQATNKNAVSLAHTRQACRYPANHLPLIYSSTPKLKKGLRLI
jgi:hypothetical protein